MSGNLLTTLVIGACILSISLVGQVECRSRNYEGYSVFRCEPQTSGQVDQLRAFMSDMDSNDGVEFWTEPTDVHRSVDIMVEPRHRRLLLRQLKQWAIPHEEIIDDLAHLINRSSPRESVLNRNQLSANETLRAQLMAPERYHKQYHSYAEIEAKLMDLAELDPRVTFDVIGQSTQRRNIYLVKVSSDPAANKPVILIDGGHHAREWISHATVVYLIESLVNVDIPRVSASSCWTEKCRRASASKVRPSLDDYDYWFVPVVNPDGYEYTITTDRLWRKTRSHSPCRGSEGVDPNRNYPFHWMEAGASSSSCSDIYAGPKPQSEPEVQAVVRVMDTFKNRIAMYLSFHSYSQLILSPYGYGRVYPDNYNELKLVADSWIESTAQLRGTQYRFGPASVVLYPAAGGSDDYAHGVANIRFAYTIELPDTGRYGFVLPPAQIIQVGHETVMGVRAMIETMSKIRAQ